ncbi:hypothetical protein GC170_21320 [bacterium]|nr:hypothetical protein [bacterium]
MRRLRKTVLTTAAMLVIVLGATAARALEVLVTVDASSVANSTPGSLNYQFSAGNPTAQTAQVVVSDFSSTALNLGGITYTNSASGGPLPADVTILNNPAVLSNRANQAVTFGASSSMSFSLTFTGNALTTPSTADSTFYFSLLDGSNQSIFGAYTLPHLTITIPASGSGVPVISSIPLITAVVPEPGSIGLTTMATMALALVLSRKTRRCRDRQRDR